MNFEILKRYWPNAHPNWKIILRKKDGKVYIKEKEKEEDNFFPIHSTVQETEKVFSVR